MDGSQEDVAWTRVGRPLNRSVRTMAFIQALVLLVTLGYSEVSLSSEPSRQGTPSAANDFTQILAASLPDSSDTSRIPGGRTAYLVGVSNSKKLTAISVTLLSQSVPNADATYLVEVGISDAPSIQPLPLTFTAGADDDVWDTVLGFLGFTAGTGAILLCILAEPCGLVTIWAATFTTVGGQLLVLRGMQPPLPDPRDIRPPATQ